MSTYKYYYVDENSERQGPFFLEDLAQRSLSPTTLVWRKGMASWMKAGEVEELASLFQTVQEPDQSGPDIEELYRKATLCLANQQFDEAGALIDQLLATDSTEPRYLELQEILKQATQPEPPQPEPAQQQPEPPQQPEHPSSIIYCTQCGQRMSSDVGRCPKCGAPVAQGDAPGNAPLEITEAVAPAAIPPQQPQQPQPAQPYQPQPQPAQPYQEQPSYPYGYDPEPDTKNRFPVGAIIGAIIAALVLGGLCLYMFVIRPNQSNNQDTDDVEWTITEDGETNPGLEDEHKTGQEKEPERPPKPQPVEKTKFVVVNGVNVRLRTSPAINDYNIITDRNGKNLHPDKYARLKYLGDYGDFYKVYFKGYECYITKEYSYLVEE